MGGHRGVNMSSRHCQSLEILNLLLLCRAELKELKLLEGHGLNDSGSKQCHLLRELIQLHFHPTPIQQLLRILVYYQGLVLQNLIAVGRTTERSVAGGRQLGAAVAARLIADSVV